VDYAAGTAAVSDLGGNVVAGAAWSVCAADCTAAGVLAYRAGAGRADLARGFGRDGASIP